MHIKWSVTIEGQGKNNDQPNWWLNGGDLQSISGPAAMNANCSWIKQLSSFVTAVFLEQKLVNISVVCIITDFCCQ